MSCKLREFLIILIAAAMRRERAAHHQRFVGCAVRTLLIVFIAAAAALPAHAQGWKPSKHVELIVPFAPGAGVDVVARTMHAIWTSKRLVETTSSVVNKPGGGGNIGMAYAAQHAGDPHYLVLGSATLLTNHIVGASKLSHVDFTPIAIVLGEHIVFSVRADSPLKTGADLLRRIRSDPQSVSISIGSAAGNINHIAVASVAKAAGADAKRLKVVVFGSSGEGMTALLGGHVDVSVSTLGVIVPQIEAGKLRALAITTPRRLGGALANVPTWIEQGIPTELTFWRGILGPKGLAADQVEFWERVLATVSKSDEWQAMAREHAWDATFQGPRAMQAYLERDYAAERATLTELGMAK